MMLLSTMPTLEVLRESKALVRNVNRAALEQANERECEALKRVWGSPQGMDSILKYLQKMNDFWINKRTYKCIHSPSHSGRPSQVPDERDWSFGFEIMAVVNLSIDHGYTFDCRNVYPFWGKMPLSPVNIADFFFLIHSNFPWWYLNRCWTSKQDPRFRFCAADGFFYFFLFNTQLLFQKLEQLCFSPFVDLRKYLPGFVLLFYSALWFICTAVPW